MKKTASAIALVALILLTLAAWYAAYRSWKKDKGYGDDNPEDAGNPFANAKTKNVKFNGAPWWKEVDRLYKTKGGTASAIVARLIEHYRENTDEHQAIMETQDVHQSTDPAYLLVLYAFNTAVEMDMIELRQFQAV